MESWAYASEGKGPFFSDEIDLSVDAFTKSRKALTGWDKESVESMGFIDLGLSELLKKPSDISNTVDVGNVVFAERGGDSSSKVVVTSPNCILGSNSSLESGSNLSNSFRDSSSQDSSLIDLKLGRFVDGKDGVDRKFYEERSVLSSVNQTIPSKRARAVNSRVQTPFCQVYGCNKDLSSSKDYHKRHKVCDVHSKTPKVTVNGIEQRFCQQCSRFHLLVEFDDGKRSCRKRLAGHNERRRKPQFPTLAVKPQKLLQSYQGTKFLEASLPKRASFLFPNIIPGGVLFAERSEHSSWSRNVKVEEREIFNPRIGISKTSGQLSPLLHLNDCKMQSSCGISSAPTENYSVFNTESTPDELAGVPNSSCALSLLSAESHELEYTSGHVMDRTSISQASHAHQSSSISDKTVGMWFPQKNVSSDFISSGITSTEINHMGSFMVSDIGYGAATHQTEQDSFPQALDFLNIKYCASPDRGSTVNLLELSSHLQRVEQQRNSMHMKHENEELYRFVATYKV